MVELMPALARDEPPADRPAYEVQVADEVEHLVAHTFVGPVERVIQRTVRRDDQQFLRRQVLAHAARAEVIGLVLKGEGTRRRELSLKIIAAQGERVGLTTDRR